MVRNYRIKYSYTYSSMYMYYNVSKKGRENVNSLKNVVETKLFKI